MNILVSAQLRYEALIVQAILDVAANPSPHVLSSPELSKGAATYHLFYSRERPTQRTRYNVLGTSCCFDSQQMDVSRSDACFMTAWTSRNTSRPSFCERSKSCANERIDRCTAVALAECRRSFAIRNLHVLNGLSKRTTER